MVSLQLPAAALFPVSRLRNDKPSSSLKLYSTAGKATAEGLSRAACHKPRLAAVSISSSGAGMSDVQLPEELRPELMPKHVALIMDGSGRWAKSRGLPVQRGHKAGSMNLRTIISSCCKFGIKVFTVFAFSTENWKRSKTEVDFLMRSVEDFIRKDVKYLIERHGIHFSAIGNRSRLPESLQSAISSAEESSKANKGMHLVSALSYSGQYDIVEATKRIASKVEDRVLHAGDIDEALFGQQLMTRTMEFPNPDLLIRTSGEVRVSNFMLWQLAYTELYFSDKTFPDFGEAELVQALASFQRRQRRFGERSSD